MDPSDAGSSTPPLQELFFSLKMLAKGNKTLAIKELWVNLPSKFEPGPVFNKQLKQLEEAGMIRRVHTTTGLRGRPPLTHVVLLREEFSLPKAPPEQVKPVSSPVPAHQPVASVQVPPTPLPPVVPAPSKPQGVAVFIDENQVIALERDGRKLNFFWILEKVRKCAGEKIERVFFYCSDATERQNRVAIQSLFRLDSSFLRVIKTGSQPGVVDKRIREDMWLWSRVDFVSTIVLATADGGPDFVEAIIQAKNAGKKLVLMKLSGVFNKTLSQLADSLIDASTSGLMRRPFEDIVLAAENGNLFLEDRNTQFVVAIAVSLKDFFNSTKDVQFGEIIEHTRRFIREIRDFDGFTEEDMREALDALVQKGHLLTWNRQSGKNYYRLTSRRGLLDVLEKKFPAHSRA